MAQSLRALLGSAATMHEVLYVESGQFVVPVGVTRIYAEVVSAAGGSCYANAFAATGGGGALAAGWVDVVPGQVIPVVVGAAGPSLKGISSTVSTPGGSSSFGTLLSATGGGATNKADVTGNYLPAEGGVAYGGQVQVNGAPGALAYIYNWTTPVTYNGGTVETPSTGKYVMTAPGAAGPLPGAFEWPGSDPVLGTSAGTVPPVAWASKPPNAKSTHRQSLPRIASGLSPTTGAGCYNSVIGGASGLTIGIYQVTDRFEMAMPSTQGYVRVRF